MFWKLSTCRWVTSLSLPNATRSERYIVLILLSKNWHKKFQWRRLRGSAPQFFYPEGDRPIAPNVVGAYMLWAFAHALRQRRHFPIAAAMSLVQQQLPTLAHLKQQLVDVCVLYVTFSCVTFQTNKSTWFKFGEFGGHKSDGLKADICARRLRATGRLLRHRWADATRRAITRNRTDITKASHRWWM